MLSKLSEASGVEEGAFLSLEVLGMCLRALHLGLWHLFFEDEEAPGWFSVIQLSGSISHGKVQGSRQEFCVGCLLAGGSLERVLAYVWRQGVRAAAAGPFRVPLFASCCRDNAL